MKPSKTTRENEINLHISDIFSTFAPEFVKWEIVSTLATKLSRNLRPNCHNSVATIKSNQAEKKSNQVEQKSTQVEQESNQVHLTAKQRKVLEFCDEMPRTAQEILDMLGVQNQNKTRQQYTTKLVLAGLLRPTTTHKNDSNRRYITAHPSTEQ